MKNGIRYSVFGIRYMSLNIGYKLKCLIPYTVSPKLNATV